MFYPLKNSLVQIKTSKDSEAMSHMEMQELYRGIGKFIRKGLRDAC